MYLIGIELFKEQKYNSRIFFAVICAVTGFWGPIQLSELGSSINDALLSSAVLAGTYFLIQISASRRSLLISGFLFGVGVGLKLTFLPYLIAGLLIGGWREKRNVVSIFYFLISLGAGLIITDGIWMFTLLKHYQSPLFPFYNSFFKSPYFLQINFRDMRWIPKSFFEIFNLPFLMWSGKAKNMEPFYQDGRYLILLMIGTLYLLKRCAQIFLLKKHKESDPFTWLSIFFLISTSIWFMQFGYQRYAVPLEMLAPLISCYCFLYLFKNRWKTVGTFLIVGIHLLTIFSVESPNWGHDGWGSKLCELSPEQYKRFENVTILASSAQPYSFVIPFFPPSTRFVDVDNGLVNHNSAFAFKEDYEKALTSAGPFFLLINEQEVLKMKSAFTNDEVTDCEPIKTIVDRIKLCRFINHPSIAIR
jgi:hypothetical protein